jgi:hypothetical protein
MKSRNRSGYFTSPSSQLTKEDLTRLRSKNVTVFRIRNEHGSAFYLDLLDPDSGPEPDSDAMKLAIINSFYTASDTYLFKRLFYLFFRTYK